MNYDYVHFAPPCNTYSLARFPKVRRGGYINTFLFNMKKTPKCQNSLNLWISRGCLGNKTGLPENVLFLLMCVFGIALFLCPFRSKLHPHGLPGIDDEGVSIANRITENMCSMIRYVLNEVKPVMISIENPRSSLLWAVPSIQNLTQEFFGENVVIKL